MQIEKDCIYQRKRANAVALYKIKEVKNGIVTVINLRNKKWYEYTIERFEKLFNFYSKMRICDLLSEF